MKVLLDTNTLLLFAVGSGRLSPRVRNLIEAQEDELIVSAIVPWELVIKSSAGRLELPDSAATVYRSILAEIRGRELAITAEHALRVSSLPALHADPFDRLLVAQALVEGVPIATNDRAIQRYAVDVIW